MGETIRNRSDFAIVVPSYLDDYGLDPYEYRIYSHIVRRAGKNGCFESIPNMAKHCLISEKIVRRSLKILLDSNLIAVVSSIAGKSVVYEITPKEEWLKPETLLKLRQKYTPGKSATTTPGKSATTTPGKSATTTPGKSATTTPGKSATTTPGKSATTPLANLPDEVFPSKEVPFKELQIKEYPPYPQNENSEKGEGKSQPVEVEVFESGSALDQIGFPDQIKPESFLPTDNPSLRQNSAAPLTKAETTADRVRRVYQETGNLPRIPAELEAWVQSDLGSEIVASYRKSGRITTIKQGDIEPAFASYVASQWKGKDIDYGYSYIRSLEKDPTKWETLAALVIKWQASKTTNNHHLNITQEIDRASKPVVDFGGIRL